MLCHAVSGNSCCLAAKAGSSAVLSDGPRPQWMINGSLTLAYPSLVPRLLG